MGEVREQVRDRYAAAAKLAPGNESGCCGGAGEDDCCGGQEVFGPKLYRGLKTGEVPDEALLASLGCGNPTAVAELHEGETVLDLGSGGGIDVLLSAARVGPMGKAYGLDMTDEMLALAEENRVKAGADNVEFLKGYIEDIPLPDGSVDVVISNCVINLSEDKGAVLGEISRVLRPGGRMGVSDVVADDHLTVEDRRLRGDFAGCIAGALSFAEYRAGLGKAGLTDIEIAPTHQVADGMYAAIVKARKTG